MQIPPEFLAVPASSARTQLPVAADDRFAALIDDAAPAPETVLPMVVAVDLPRAPMTAMPGLPDGDDVLTALAARGRVALDPAIGAVTTGGAAGIDVDEQGPTTPAVRNGPTPEGPKPWPGPQPSMPSQPVVGAAQPPASAHAPTGPLAQGLTGRPPEPMQAAPDPAPIAPDPGSPTARAPLAAGELMLAAGQRPPQLAQPGREPRPTATDRASEPAAPRTGTSVEPSTSSALQPSAATSAMPPVLAPSAMADMPSDPRGGEPPLSLVRAEAGTQPAPLATQAGQPATTITAPPGPLAGQLALAARSLPGGPVEIALAPAELGRVTLTLLASETSITVTLSAERPETLDLMRRSIGQLADDLRNLGYDSPTFAFGGDGGGGRDPDRRDAPSMAAVPESLAMAVAPVRVSEGLDLRL